jgi:Uma2 family endonuclease
MLAQISIGVSPMSLTTLPTATTPILAPPGPPAQVNSPGPSYLSHMYRLTVKQYDQMVEAGILGKRDRVELIEGILVAKMGRNRPHIVSGKKALRTLERAILPGWHVAKEDPAVVSDLSKPEPDLAVVRGQAEDYIERDVEAADIALVVEIADSTLRADQQEMKPIYAASALPVYWIINLVDHQLEVYSDPEGREYRTSQVFSREQDVPLIIGGTEVGRIRVADLLP